MSDPPTPLNLPPTLPYPIRISRLLVKPGSDVSRGSSLFEYAFASDSSRRALAQRGDQPGQSSSSGGNANELDMVGSWESGIEGEVVRWAEWVKPGYVVEKRTGSRPVLWMQQPCSHPVQLHGMCAVCGKDLTSDDYLTRPGDEGLPQAGPSRPAQGFEMSHDSLGVTVSTNEAVRLETQTRDTLLADRRLSLIVDLDQTIIHTTVDPTVGEWMNEIEEERKAVVGPDQDVPMDDSGQPGATKNPNTEALSDVATFTLPDDPPPGFVLPMKNGKPVPLPERRYYTKPRPGLQNFLESVDKLYEMHVYTMGTRTYAEAICKIVDPSGKYFGGRIISREENGNFNSKNLARLFPTDQSMVVVIDDRADVWGNISNLVKVVPYDFFIGIGDINSSYLPPQPSGSTTPSLTSDGSSQASASPEPSTPDESATAQSKLLDQVSEERPLAKLQAQLEEESGTQIENEHQGNDGRDPPAVQEAVNGTQTEPTSSPKAQSRRKPLLTNNDNELQRIKGILRQVHRDYYHAYDGRADKAPDARVPLGCDVELIIPELKSRVLDGCNIVFSGLIPKHEQPESSEIYLTAETFGARPMIDITPSTTHCVIATVGTEKAYRAFKLGAKVVWAEWFRKSVALWEKQDETEFLAMTGSTSKTDIPRVPSGQNVPDIQVTGANGMKEGDPVSHLGLDGLNPARTEEEDGPSQEDDEVLTGQGWDDAADAELQAFLEGSSDYGGTDAGETDSRLGDSSRPASPPRSPSPTRSILRSPGRSPSPPLSVPGSPRKRVRYADEEFLPLESFSDPPPPDESERQPKRRLLLEAPRPGEVPPENVFQWRGKERREREEREQREAAQSKSNATDQEDEDVFAKMLQDSLDDNAN